MLGEASALRARTPVVVAVVSWNTRELLDRCLRSLKPDAEAGRVELWVVDNASRDGSAEMVSHDYPWVRLLALEENLGYGRAVNLVAARTDSEWLVAANADVAVETSALARLLAAGERDPAAGIIAPRLVLPSGDTQRLAWAFPTVLSTLGQNLGPRILPRRLAERLVLYGAWDPERARRIPWAVGAFLLIRRRAWDEVGGFDRELWMSAEDLDLGWRMRAGHWATRYEPSAVVHHEESAATRTVWGEDLAIHWQRCAYAWMLRRFGRTRTSLVGLINFAGSGMRLLLRTALAGPRGDRRLRGMARWTAVHLYAFAPRRTLERYR